MINNPTTLPTATDSQAGVLRIATPSEVAALAAGNLIVTPSGLPYSSTSQRGLIRTSTLGTFQAGTSADYAVTPQNVRQALGITKYYESANQTITTGGKISLSHSLGAIPKIIVSELVCLTAEHNYAVGDRLVMSNAFDNEGASSGWGHQIVKDSTQIHILYVNLSTVYRVRNKNTTANNALTNANWALVIRAWG